MGPEQTPAHRARQLHGARPPRATQPGTLDHPDPALLDANHDIARRHFSLDALTSQLGALLRSAGWA